MKISSDAYIEKEQASQRQPVELYHIWHIETDQHWRYTSGDVSVSFGGHDYDPVTIKRGSITYNTELEVSSLAVDVARVTVPFASFVAQNPIEVLWIQVSRLFRDQDPLEASVVFIGQIKTASIKGVSTRLHCTGFESYLRQPIPVERYQAQCNWTIFDLNNPKINKCKLSKNSYKLTTTVIVSSNGLELTSADFALQDDGHYQLGYIYFEGQRRLIAAHAGSVVTLRFSIPELESSDTVDAYPGCDGSIVTCRDKYNNVINFGGMPYIPLDNPTTWK